MTSRETPLRPRPHAGVLAIEPYVPGKSKVHGYDGPIHKLSSNENPLGPSPQAVTAYRAAADSLSLYADDSVRELRTALGERHGLDPARIVCSTGSNDILYMLALVYCEPGTEGIYAEHGFLLYPTVIRYAGATAVVVRERDLTVDVDAILAAVTERTRIVYIANPNNPTGTYIAKDEVARLADSLPPNVLLVLDLAYAEYADADDYDASFDLAHDRENVVITRTFSKIYGLAALRVGWCYAPAAVCDALNRVRVPFCVNGPAMRAGLAAVGDAGHVAMSVAHNTKWRAALTRSLRDLGFGVTGSVANFILVHLRDKAEAGAADAFLMARGLIIRRVGAYGLPQCLRVSIGTEEDNRLLLEAFADFAKQRQP